MEASHVPQLLSGEMTRADADNGMLLGRERNEVPIYGMTQMNLENITLSEWSQTQMSMRCILHL